MLTLTLSLTLALVTRAPPPEADTPAWDPQAAALHHEAFVHRLLAAHWGEQKTTERFRGAANKPRPETNQAPFPIDKARGFYANSAKSRAKPTWLGVGLEAWPPDDVGATKLGALFELDYHFEYGFNEDAAPVTCLPEASPARGYRGAAACYFAIKAEYFDPGFWVALRQVGGQVVLAGVLMHKHALEDPAKEHRLAAFLGAIDKRFAPPAHPAPGEGEERDRGVPR